MGNSMKTYHLILNFLFLLLSMSATNFAFAAEVNSQVGEMPVPISQKVLTSKIKDAEANTSLDEIKKIRLLDYYHKTLRYLEYIEANKNASEAFMRSQKTNLEQATSIREKLEQRQSRATDAEIVIFRKNTPFTEMERQLLTVKANLSAVKAKLSDIEQQIMLADARPNTVQQSLIEANNKQELNTAKLLESGDKEDLPLLNTALRWMLETKQLALRTEISMLDQELLSLPMRIDFLEAKQASYTYTINRIRKKVEYIQLIVNQQRQIEADKVKAKAEIAKEALKGKHVLIQQLASDNTKLTDELSDMTAQYEHITKDIDKTKITNEQLTKQFQNLRKKLEIGGYGRSLSKIFIEQNRQLPNTDLYTKRTKLRKNKIVEVAWLQLQYREENKALSSLSNYIEKQTIDLSELEFQETQNDLMNLATQRKKLLRQLNQLSSTYLNALSNYQFIDQKLNTTIENFDEFILGNLHWMRSAPLPSLKGIQELPSGIAWLVSSELWGEVFTALSSQAQASPVVILGMIIFVLLTWKSRAIRNALRATGINVGKVSKDNIGVTFNALFLTLLLAAIWPLLLVMLGWQLSASSQATEFTIAVSQSLIKIGINFLFLQIIRVSFEAGGLSDAHFQLSVKFLQSVHRKIGLLMLTLFPPMFILLLLNRYDLASAVGEAGRVLLAIILIILTVFFNSIVPSKKRWQQHTTAQHTDKYKLRWYFLRFLLVGLPLIFIIIDMLGYSFTVAILTNKLIITLWFVLILVLIKKILVRWLHLIQRRLSLQSTLEKRADLIAKREAESATQAELESETGDIEEPEIDFTSLSKESMFLLKVAINFAGIIGVLWIWAYIMPALSFLDEKVIWSSMALVAGEQELVPVTLLDLIQALMILFVTFFVAAYLPSLMEIIMLQRTSLNAGNRYTVITITNYIIVAFGLILFFNMLAVDWSKIQWLVAALGVGIGFGLQEIVANFISGIIILFERPIRVGDVISIGGKDGTVVRIQIRATTIRDWDRKELLVPNKEFITGQLINWTLSDEITRVVIPVGLAYGGNVEQALKLMLEAANDIPEVMDDPGASVVFDQFGDNALSLKLRCFVPAMDYRIPTITALHKVINQKFNDAGLVIAFPQCDVHLDSEKPLDIRIRRS